MILLLRFLLSLSVSILIGFLLFVARKQGQGRRTFYYLLAVPGIALCVALWTMWQERAVGVAQARNVAGVILTLIYLLAIWGIVRRRS